MSNLIKVGYNRPKEVSELNKELFDKAKGTLSDDADSGDSPCWHIGWIGVSKFIDLLESEYDITKKGD